MTKRSQTRARINPSFLARHFYAAPFFPEKHAVAQLSNRINSLAEVASQSVPEPFNRISYLETVVSQLSP